jgi:D-serine deaminase-like pyridoxal phosphate-dependent protein
MQSDNSVWYTIKDVEQIDSPALVIYLDRVRHNIEVAKSMIGDVSRLRPHVKTHKTKEVTLLMMEAGITKFKCATIAEAEMLAMCNASDVLLAYQPVGPKLSRFISLIIQYPQTKFSCLVDNLNSAKNIAANAIANGLQANVFIDVNVGMHRTGIVPVDVYQLYKECVSCEGLHVRGLHAYDGHIFSPDFAKRKQDADAAYDKVNEVRNQLVLDGFVDPTIVIGGSPTYPIHAKRSYVECSPGTFVFWDKGYSNAYPEMDFKPAAIVLTRVI